MLLLPHRLQLLERHRGRRTKRPECTCRRLTFPYPIARVQLGKSIEAAFVITIAVQIKDIAAL